MTLLHGSTQQAPEENRRYHRYSVPAMYSLVRARGRGEGAFQWTGHLYDVSLGGMRFELDQSLEPGTEVDIRAMLPGAEHRTFRVRGEVVRLHNEDEADRGPARMGLSFTRFQSRADRQAVESYIAAREGRLELTEATNRAPAAATTPARAA
jgi:c-di-GMP-binding flagellar brake protein YcgR